MVAAAARIKQALRASRRVHAAVGAVGRSGIPNPLVTPRRRVQRLLESLHPVQTSTPLVRIGPPCDGGYLLPDDLEGITALFSPGVGNTSAIERSFADLGVDVFLLDGSVEGPAEEHARFRFTKKFLGPRTTPEALSLADWVAASAPGNSADLVLQMDIEGAEYEALQACPVEVLTRFRIIVVEFHMLQRLFSAKHYRTMEPAFRTLLTTHACVHIHPNNCCGALTIDRITLPCFAEFTFIRRDRLPTGATRYASVFPHPLDRDNVEALPTLQLPASLIRQSDR